MEVHEPEPSTEGSFSFRSYYPALLCAVAEGTGSGTGLTKPLPLPVVGAGSEGANEDLHQERGAAVLGQGGAR